MPNDPAQARRAYGDRIEPKGSTGVALQAGWFGKVMLPPCSNETNNL
jgi:hypothetical protein